MKRVIFAGLLVSGVAAYLWVAFFSDAWLAEFNDERQQAAEQFRSEGRAFGDQVSQQGCFDTALRRVENCRSPICSVDTGNFLRGCFETSQPTSGFCEGVPAYQEKITEDEKSWARYGCWEINNKSDGCRLLKRQQQALCSNIE